MTDLCLPVLALIVLAAWSVGLVVRELVALVLGIPRPQNNLPVLAVLAAIAPLVGLLGTVVGLVSIFAAAEHPSAIADGIGEALLTTQLGLMIAVPVLLARVLLLRLREHQHVRELRA